MRYISYCLSILLLLFILSSCGSESTPVYSLTTTATPEEAGSVSPTSGEYDEGETVEITATPNADWVFDGWEGDASGSDNPTSITIDGDKDIAATFALREYPLTIETEGEGTVSEQILQEKTTDYEVGTTVELTAEPADGWEFVEWQGDLEGSQNPQQITVDDEKNVTAVFERQDYDLTIEIQGEGNVEQEVLQSKTTEYEGGTEVKLTAMTEGDWRFVGWKEDATGTESEITVTIDRDKTIIASFDNSDFEDGDGSEEYPYEVATVEQLQDIRNYSDRYFILVNDINASETESWNDGQGFKPVGDRDFPFKGVLNGNGHTINSLYIDRPTDTNMGLVQFAIEASVKNLTLNNMYLKGYDISGGLIAVCEGSEIVSSSVSGSFKLGRGSGGLIGQTDENCEIVNSSTDIEIEGTFQILGGLVGENYGLIHSSSTSGKIISDSHEVGGLVGVNLGVIRNSSSSVHVSMSDESNMARRYGGLVGVSIFGEIHQSFATGDVKGVEAIGGLVGANTDALIVDSYSTGTVEGDEEIGGLIGRNISNNEDAVLKNSYSSGIVHANSYGGGLIGVNTGNIESSYWDSEKSVDKQVGRGDSEGAVGLNTSEMQGSSAEENMPEFDWNEIWITVSDSYPVLRWQE